MITSIRRFVCCRSNACALSALLVLIAAGIVVQAQSFNVLSNLSTNTGYDSVAQLLQGSDGNFYGTTSQGGNMSDCQLNGCGTIFQITPAGTITVIHAFTGNNDGYAPASGLVEVNGVLYGTTAHGGGSFGAQQGTIFRVAPDGSNFATFYTFSGGKDGGSPEGALLLGMDGNLYGTTSQGGQGQNTTCVPGGCGTIFSIAPDGSNFKTLHQFSGPDGSSPAAALIQDPGGNFYGTTSNGGAFCDPTLTCGTVFMFQAADPTLTTLHYFNATTDGAHPVSALVRGPDGTLYGTAQYGGNLNCGINIAAEGCGTIFAVSGNTFNVLWTFQGTEGGGDGAQPFSGLTFGADGKLYGSTAYGGAGGGACTFAGGCGSIFSATTTGTVEILHSFTGPDGSNPSAALVESNGVVFGTTAYGGSSNCGAPGCGTLFSLSISAADISTSTAVMVSPVSIEQGSTNGVTLTANVSPASGSESPTGSVSFSNGTTQIGQAELSGGTATVSYNVSALAPNTYFITATYGGDSNFSASNSSAATLTVTPTSSGLSPTTTTVTVTGNPSAMQSDVGSTVTLTATVAHTAGSAALTGTVTFTSGSMQIGSGTLVNGIATYSTGNLAAGQYSVIAKYSGDANYAVSSSSGGLLDVVDFRLASSPATVTIASPGQSGSATLTISPLDGFNQNVTFTCAGLPALATCSFVNIANGATMTISTQAQSAMVEKNFDRMPTAICALFLPSLFGLISVGAGSRNWRRLGTLGMLCVVALLSLCTGCGLGNGRSFFGGTGGSNTGTPAGTTTVTVTASAGSLTHQTTITLNVQ